MIPALEEEGNPWSSAYFKRSRILLDLPSSVLGIGADSGYLTASCMQWTELLCVKTPFFSHGLGIPSSSLHRTGVEW